MDVRDQGAVVRVVREELRALLELQLTDNCKARIIDRRQKNPYVRAGTAERVRAQSETYRLLEGRLEAARAARARTAALPG